MKITILCISFILVCVMFAQVVRAQTTPQIPQNLDSLQNQVMKLMKYYESYDNGSPESLKKANYKDAVKEITDGTATQKEIDESYKILDWYIKGDKAIGSEKNGNPGPIPNPDDNDFDDLIENSDQAKAATNYINQQKGMLQNMSYSEFEGFVLKANAGASKSDIKKAYNELHKTDGKQVSISAGDKKMTDAQKQMWAIDTLNNPKNYDDFKKACKIMNPNIADSEIRKVWEQNKNN